MPILSEELRWLQQAERARRLAAALPPVDARVLEAFAQECETKAEQAARPTLRAA